VFDRRGLLVGAFVLSSHMNTANPIQRQPTDENDKSGNSPSRLRPNEQFFTPKQLSERWKICTLTIRRWRQEGRITAMKLGRAIRFSATEVERIERESLV
jgi:excisionase family DNA binding protein